MTAFHSNKKDQTTGTTTWKTPLRHAEQKPDTKEYMLHRSIYTKFKNRQNKSELESDCSGAGVISWEGAKENLMEC